MRTKLPHLDRWNKQRREIAEKYNTAFARLPLSCPNFFGEEYVGHLYVVRTPHRDSLKSHLASLGIATDIHYPIADYLQSAYLHPSKTPITLPTAEEACQQVISLPCYPGLTAAEIDYVINGVKEYFRTSGN